MNFSAASSSSSVVTPGRIFASSRSMQRTWISPALAISSISADDFLRIIGSELGLEAQRGQGSPDVVVDLRGRPRAVEAAQDAALLVVLDQRDRLLVVDA